LYATEDVDLKEVIRVLLAEVERVKPSRVVFDSLSEERRHCKAGRRKRRRLRKERGESF
jgi:circadian clock protein KaiC